MTWLKIHYLGFFFFKIQAKNGSNSKEACRIVGNGYWGKFYLLFAFSKDYWSRLDDIDRQQGLGIINKYKKSCPSCIGQAQGKPYVICYASYPRYHVTSFLHRNNGWTTWEHWKDVPKISTCNLGILLGVEAQRIGRSKWGPLDGQGAAWAAPKRPVLEVTGHYARRPHRWLRWRSGHSSSVNYYADQSGHSRLRVRPFSANVSLQLGKLEEFLVDLGGAG